MSCEEQKFIETLAILEYKICSQQETFNRLKKAILSKILKEKQEKGHISIIDWEEQVANFNKKIDAEKNRIKNERID